MDLGLGQGIYTSNTNGTINGVNNGVIHGTANGVYNEVNYIDPNAQAFILAARITNMMQKSAINNLVKSLKSAGIWSKCNAIYPFVGGNERSHSFNLINTAQYQLTFFGGWTHASTGATPNGTNGYADTFIVPNTVMGANSAHLSYYSRTNSAVNLEIAMGVLNSTTGAAGLNLVIRRSGGDLNSFRATEAAGATGLVNSTSTDARGLTSGSITASNSRKLYKNGTLLNTNSSTITWGRSSDKLYLGAGLATDTGLAAFFTNKECAFASIGSGLTDAEAATLYTIVQTYQTLLNRNV